MDQTDIDALKVKEIKKGKTTREEVIVLLGPPPGLFMYPITDKPGLKRLAYVHTGAVASQQWKKLDLHHKGILVTVDSNDIVTDVKFNECEETK